MMKNISLQRDKRQRCCLGKTKLKLELLEGRLLLAADGLCGDVRGTIWSDVNENSSRDSNEPGLPGVTVYADLNRNGSLASSP